jgi:predicted transcriptional regulator
MAAVREGLADDEAGRLVDDEELDSFLDENFGPLQPE